MTVIVKRVCDGKVFSFMKGADSIILDRLTAESR